jgi:hypothetical protein
MKKHILLALFLTVTVSCSSPATSTPVPTSAPTPIPPTPVGYGVDFPINPDQFKEWGENVSATCEQDSAQELLDPETARKLIDAKGKLNYNFNENSNLVYLWTGNVPLELFVEPPDDGTGSGIYYDYWWTPCNVRGLAEDVNDWGVYVLVITKVTPTQ